MFELEGLYGESFVALIGLANANAPPHSDVTFMQMEQ